MHLFDSYFSSQVVLDVYMMSQIQIPSHIPSTYIDLQLLFSGIKFLKSFVQVQFCAIWHYGLSMSKNFVIGFYPDPQ